MISVLIEAALRSLLVGLAVAAGLRVFRVRNVFAQKAAWFLVLVTALAMPWLMPMMARWQVRSTPVSIMLPAHPMTLLEELQARLQAKSASGRAPKPVTVLNPPVTTPGNSASPEESAWPESSSGREPDAPHPEMAGESVSLQSHPRPVRAGAPTKAAGPREKAAGFSPNSHRFAISPSALVFGLYLAGAGVLLLRLIVGLGFTLRLWLTATPISGRKLPGIGAGHLRASSKVYSPLTVGSGILLPADFETWDREKLRIVLAHERAHIRQGDFYVQLLSGLYAALVWFSPLGWWLKRALADLAEAISDRAGIEEARSRTSYAQILLEFAAAPRQTAMGVAMARPSSLSRRIERLLNDHAFRQSFDGGRRILTAVALVPMALFAATMMVRVQAATQQVQNIVVKSAGAHAAGASTLSASPAAANRIAEQAEAKTVVTNGLILDTVYAAPGAPTILPELETAETATPEIGAAPAEPQLFRATAMAPAMAGRRQSQGSTFDRTLTVNGETQLMVSTGSGNIHLTRGSSGQIRIHGQVRADRDGSEQEAQQIAANPPIEQSGNVIRVGLQHEHHWEGISIDYEIEAPAETLLTARSGSGEIVDEGVGQNAKLETGSGDLVANGLEGSMVLRTGSGNITAEQSGEGDVKIETGSGDIAIKDVHGSFHARTGSGDIKASGTPSAAWTLETGSGNVEIWSGNAALTLDASTGSGSVATDHEMLVQGALNPRHITGSLNGGGPLVRVQTGSGDIHVH